MRTDAEEIFEEKLYNNLHDLNIVSLLAMLMFASLPTVSCPSCF